MVAVLLLSCFVVVLAVVLVVVVFVVLVVADTNVVAVVCACEIDLCLDVYIYRGVCVYEWI